MIGYRCSWILRDGGDVDFSWIRDIFVGTVDGFNRKIAGYLANMYLRGDCS